jgi:hypothetical protein
VARGAGGGPPEAWVMGTEMAGWEGGGTRVVDESGAEAEVSGAEVDEEEAFWDAARRACSSSIDIRRTCAI